MENKDKQIETVYGGGCPEYNKETPLSSKETIVAIDLAKGNEKFIGTALFDSVTPEAWDYIYSQGVKDRDKQWWEAVARLKKYQDLKIKLTKENKYLTKEEKELVIATCIDNKMCFDEIMGRFE